MATILSEQLHRSISVQDLWPEKQFTTPPRAANPLVGLASSEDVMEAAVTWLLNCPVQQPESTPEASRTELVSILRSRVSQLRDFDDGVGGKMTLDWILSDLSWARSLTDGRCVGETVLRELNACVSDLARMAGWLMLDQGKHDQSKALLLLSLRKAAVTGRPTMAAHIVSCLSYVYLWEGDGTQALRLAQVARRGVEGLPQGRIHAVLASRQARAHALLGELSHARRCIEEAFRALEEDADDAPWGDWITWAVIQGDAGRSWLDAGEPSAAERDLRSAVDMMSDKGKRSQLLHLTSIAEAHLDQREVDGAVDTISRALELNQHLRSARADQRLRQLRRRFSTSSARSLREIFSRMDDQFPSTDPAGMASKIAAG
ncbi:tetratricopeptide (TPR) repeat protein [Amycolatopsis bartoniae]|uniref:hypothetical protein n=1 Tax=Amycolatopsis bartoniae TaxID=941986 RepID=UPI001197DD1E|nr:hypothetical protein [Amycolatopsis bartoniae]MBB2940192.1 tetratricopeptide (TPR) repeat protein [Amycolatopsis bartoniae]TVT11285.1 hypothetical protein FNH07_02490 [Amycolatopsis bartoniae]